VDAQESQFKPSYMSFQTFWNFMQELTKLPLPPQIDRSLMDSKSGTDQANLTAALKGFGFIRDDLTVEPLLQQFVETDEAGQKAILRGLVAEHYHDALQVSANNGTEKLLHDSFREVFDLDAAETRRKAITFFLHAARTSGIALSPHFPATRSGSGGGGTPRAKKPPKRKTGSTGGGPSGTSSSTPNGNGAPRGETKVFDFGEAGTVTLNVDLQWLKLPTDQMITVRKLVDLWDAVGAGEVVDLEEDDDS
jgi:hypothetical protein